MRRLGKVKELAGTNVVLSWSVIFVVVVVVFFCRTQHHCGMSMQPSIMERSGISHLAERRSERPGAALTRVRFLGAARVCFCFSPRVNFQCRLSYGVYVASMCNCILQQCCVRTLKIPSTDSHAIVWIRETMIGSPAHTDRNG